MRTSVSYVTQIRVGGKVELQADNATHQRAGAIRVDFKTGPTADSVVCDGYPSSGSILGVPSG